MTLPLREQAKAYFDKNVPPGKSISSRTNGDDFQRLTGWSQAMLDAQWKKEEVINAAKEKGQQKQITTTCNEFIGIYGRRALGAKANLGQFPLKQLFPNAWVAATENNRPKYGDVVRLTKFHVLISLDFEGDIWNTVESGQGGPSMRQDLIKRKQGTYKSKEVAGWVDIETYIRALTPVPAWLPGWWLITWSGFECYYLFERTGQVKCSQVRPASSTAPLLTSAQVGTYSFSNDAAHTTDVKINWGGAEAVETFQHQRFSLAEMTGTSNERAVRL